MTKSEQCSLRFPPGTLQRAKRIAAHMNAQPELAGLDISMSRVMVQGVLRHLDDLEEQFGLKRKKGRRR